MAPLPHTVLRLPAMELSTPWATCMAMALTTTFLLLLHHHVKSLLLRLKSVLLRSSRHRRLNLPPGPRPWPVVGSLGILGGALPPHRVLAALAARYGPLMHLVLGSFHTVVASSADTARLALKTHDLTFADRPRTIAGKYVFYNYSGIVQTPYGPYWRMARKLCATELFTTRRLNSYEYIRTQEIHALQCHLFNSSSRPVVVRDYLSNTTLRIITRMTVGEKWLDTSDGKKFKSTLDEAFMVTGAINNIAEWIPWLGWLDLQGYLRRMKKLSKMYDRFLEQIVSEHEERRREAEVELVERDIVDVLLRLMEEPNQEVELKRNGVKAFIQDIIAGGTESSAVTMEWAVSELLRRPDTLAAAAEELDRVVGHGRWVTEHDMARLPYVEAIVKETLRLHPVGPLLVPHVAREHVTMAGYDVPAGARVMVNVWAIGRDPAAWGPDPEAFRPERFIGSDIDVRGQHFDLLPFGAGRRICPAYNLALKVVGTSIANLLHGFSWRLPDGMAAKDVSMEELFGLSTRRKVPLVAIAEPKLPAHLYVV